MIIHGAIIPQAIIPAGNLLTPSSGHQSQTHDSFVNKAASDGLVEKSPTSLPTRLLATTGIPLLATQLAGCTAAEQLSQGWQGLSLVTRIGAGVIVGLGLFALIQRKPEIDSKPTTPEPTPTPKPLAQPVLTEEPAVVTPPKALGTEIAFETVDEILGALSRIPYNEDAGESSHKTAQTLLEGLAEKLEDKPMATRIAATKHIFESRQPHFGLWLSIADKAMEQQMTSDVILRAIALLRSLESPKDDLYFKDTVKALYIIFTKYHLSVNNDNLEFFMRNLFSGYPSRHQGAIPIEQTMAVINEDPSMQPDFLTELFSVRPEVLMEGDFPLPAFCFMLENKTIREQMGDIIVGYMDLVYTDHPNYLNGLFTPHMSKALRLDRELSKDAREKLARINTAVITAELNGILPAAFQNKTSFTYLEFRTLLVMAQTWKHAQIHALICFFSSIIDEQNIEFKPEILADLEQLRSKAWIDRHKKEEEYHILYGKIKDNIEEKYVLSASARAQVDLEKLGSHLHVLPSRKDATNPTPAKDENQPEATQRPKLRGLDGGKSKPGTQIPKINIIPGTRQRGSPKPVDTQEVFTRSNPGGDKMVRFTKGLTEINRFPQTKVGHEPIRVSTSHGNVTIPAFLKDDYEPPLPPKGLTPPTNPKGVDRLGWEVVKIGDISVPPFYRDALKRQEKN
jgi:hypothetical protein